MKTFKKGGIILNANKLSADSAIEIISIPETVYIPLLQHSGSPAIPVVDINDKVKTGQLIAKANGKISANVHSSVSGIVKDILEITDIRGQLNKAIIIKTEGDEWLENIDRSNTLIKDITLSSHEIIERIKGSGIVGLGGAAFPTHIKIAGFPEKKLDLLIINGAECEPYLTADHRLMLEKGEEIIVGASIFMKALNIYKAVIGIEENKKNAIDHLTEICKNYKNIEVVTLKTKFPQGYKKQIIKAITGKEVPSQKSSTDVGCIVQNIATTFAVYEAVQKNKPLIERVVTVSGNNVKKPSNILIRIGTPVIMAIDKAGGLPENTEKVVSGGPMTGKIINNIHDPIVKGTTGILVFSKREVKILKTINCIRCCKCVDVCPMGIEPYLLALLSENSNYKRFEKENITDCMECGSCAYICPSGRPVLDLIRQAKIKIKESLINYK